MQHFLLSSQARTLSLKGVFRMTDDQAYQIFCELRWPETDGEAVCPRCGCCETYSITSRRRFKCVGCHHQFSVTSGTIFASRKLSFVDLLAAIAIFVNGAKGVAALQLSRDLDVQYKTAFVLTHKLREAMQAENAKAVLDGVVEVDGAYFGGYVKPANYKEARRDRRLLANRSGKRQSVVVARERGGDIVTVTAKSEAKGSNMILAHIDGRATVHADEASHWDDLHAAFETRRINHSVCYSDGAACTNMAESYFSRLRRAEIGTHHHIAGPYLNAYASEMGWREEHRRVPNGMQATLVGAAAMDAPVSRKWAGYWQRAA
ncbi:IS1595 family transposase [Sphingomonas sp. MAH-20]|uniref:IS1595 family transposase n=1 Tax=Sphingomonas horti TaxID=2682842 RepID=A0A6I4J1H9_9SPHN|nr:MULTISPECIES: IS1595 family transposase [Sphingomonas]MBA2921081.1 IS1595 family transposase [Sphingomonas sp. CGMCC 1.13658]MVO78146.1 IS1595 family transposase [Sphingomonas horti]